MSDKKTPAEARALKALLDWPSEPAQLPGYLEAIGRAVRELQLDRDRSPRYVLGQVVDVVENVGDTVNVVYDKCGVVHIHPVDDYGIRKYQVVTQQLMYKTFNEESLRPAQ